jgi:OmpR family response regulator RpaB
VNLEISPSSKITPNSTDNNMKNILLIDDDERLASLLEEYFHRYDLQLLNATHPNEGIAQVHSNSSIDLVILDIMLPDIDGFEVCRILRKESNIPILMLTARGDVMDRIVGLEIGADDYLSKPFEPRELVARIHNILKRLDEKHPSIPEKNHILKWQHLYIDKERYLVLLNKTTLNLTNKEYALLLLLAENPDKSFDRDSIMNELSGIDAELFSRSVDILVSRLRYKLKPLKCIQTVWGKGYRFIPAHA